MGGLTTSLLIGVQALEASQAALNATSNNIANANTPGYTREVAQFSENPETLAAEPSSGGGVSLDSIQSVRDELLNLQIQQQTSQQSSADTQSSASAADSDPLLQYGQRYRQRPERIFGKPGAAFGQSFQCRGAAERVLGRARIWRSPSTTPPTR